jgi:hypothetical protein
VGEAARLERDLDDARKASTRRERPAFEHKTYHSYQYVGWGDAFIPTYLMTAGWSLLSSALAGNPQWTCFGGVNDSYTFAQPLGMGGALIDGGRQLQ